jgi:signal transduction histidine kinase
LDIKLKKYSHSFTTKMVVFIMMVVCFSGIIQALVAGEKVDNGDFGIVFEEDYISSKSYVQESERIVDSLIRLIGKYQSEEHILKGETIDKDMLRIQEDTLYREYRSHPRNDPPFRPEADYERFKSEYADKLGQVKDGLIKQDLREYHRIKQQLDEVKLPYYYASNGVDVFTNSTLTRGEQFEAYPSYLIFEGFKRKISPKEMNANEHLSRITNKVNELNSVKDVIYIAFTKEFLDSKAIEWQENKVIITRIYYRFIGFVAGFILTLFYLVLVIGRTSFKDEAVHLQGIDKCYVDLNMLLVLGLTGIWAGLMEEVTSARMDRMAIPIMLPIAAAVFMLVLSLVRHWKNHSFFKHTLVYVVLKNLITFISNVYARGGVAIKTVLLVIGYPLLIAATFFMFPVTIGVAAWFAFKRVQSFQAIKEGVERIKGGDIHHTILVNGKGEFADLAANMNRITDGLKQAVYSELKSERLKTELITNVSHDIRTPLTSIITYVDLLKNEKDPAKQEEYIEVLDQKSKRLKALTDDLFEAAKASSGNIPVHLERIELVSLLTQGLGEVNDKIEASGLDFKINYPKDKVYIRADGKLLWRSIENILSNIFKYALPQSRVYIQIEDAGHEILLTFKNISAYELNVSEEELMERFKRGDESRASQGSGLGLSIAKSLIDNQRGKFAIQIDGDLFKSMIYMPKER